MTRFIDKKIDKNAKRQRLLTSILKKKSGRNNSGKITVRHHGGRKKRFYRNVDFSRRDYDIEGTIQQFEYDPNRNATIAVVCYKNGKKVYLLATKDLKVGDKVISSRDNKVHIKNGNACKIRNLPHGTFVSNVEIIPGRGGQLARSAGTYVRFLGFDEQNKFVIIQLPSGEKRKIHGDCMGTIGEVGNKEYNLVNWGKAGRNRHRGIRPTVRGSAMNPNDHPHGGGEGKAPIGRKQPVSIWGKPALGKKTRKKKRYSNKYIVAGRNAKRS